METIAIVENGRVTIRVDAPEGTPVRVKVKPHVDEARASADALREELAAKGVRLGGPEQIKAAVNEGRKW